MPFFKSDADYRAALKAVSAGFDNQPAPGTEEGDRFDLLITMIEAYEFRHFPIDSDISTKTSINYP